MYYLWYKNSNKNQEKKEKIFRRRLKESEEEIKKQNNLEILEIIEYFKNIKEYFIIF